MKLSTRSTYGMRALIELALSSGRVPVSAALIAKRQDLSVAYLEQLLHRLKKQGLVTSLRGPKGGYILAKDPVRITMAEVVEVLDGSTCFRNGIGAGAAASHVLPAAGGTKAASQTDRKRGKPLAAKQETRAASSGDVVEEPAVQAGHAQRIAQAVWRCVHERLTQSLGAVTLQDLCDEVRHGVWDPLDHRYVFHI